MSEFWVMDAQPVVSFDTIINIDGFLTFCHTIVYMEQSEIVPVLWILKVLTHSH